MNNQIETMILRYFCKKYRKGRLVQIIIVNHKTKNIKIIKAKACHVASILELLKQVNNVHHYGRPDLFEKDKTKYTQEELSSLLTRDDMLILVAEEEGKIVGHCFCVIEKYENDHNMVDRTTLYIDDICVDENERKKGIGELLYKKALDEAKRMGCYNVTLNVWNCNREAQAFYGKMGMNVFKTGMEIIVNQQR